MIATPSINNDLSWFSGEVPPILVWLASETIGKALKERRQDIRTRKGYLGQGAMADKLNKVFNYQVISQGTISNIENERGKANIMNLPPEVRHALLELYLFTPQEIYELNDRYGLSLPAFSSNEYLNYSGTPPSDSAIVWISEISGERGGTYPMYRETLEIEGVSEEDCKAFVLDQTVLMPQSLRETIPALTVLFCTPKVEPRPDNLLAYVCKDTRKKVLLQRTNDKAWTPVLSADGTERDFFNEDDDRLEFVGVSIGRWSGGR